MGPRANFSGTLINEGERVRVSIESPSTGYLYVTIASNTPTESG